MADNNSLIKPGAHIGSVAVSVPPFTANQSEADDFFTKHYSARISPRMLSLMHKVFAHPAILRRRFAIDSPECLVDEDPDLRIGRFTRWSIELSAQAALKALEKIDVPAGRITCLVVNTCTGYICPGISTYLIERLGLPSRIKAYDLVGSGCGGAIPNLQIAASQIHGEDDIVLSVSVEICSATFQMGDDLGLILSNAIFGDGAAAAVLWKRPEGIEVGSFSSRYVPGLRDHIRYVHKKGALHNKITTQLPQLVKKEAAAVVGDLLAPLNLKTGEIRHWALHTGGDKIISEVKKELGLSEDQLRATRAVLSEYGNMSSPTVWFVLRELLDQGMEKGEWCMMLAYGAGLSAHACLLRKV